MGFIQVHIHPNTMKLEDEIRIVQFAQGHYPEASVLVDFSRLTEIGQWKRLVEVSNLLDRFGLTDSDIEQANAQFSTGNNPALLLLRHPGKAKPGLRVNMTNSEFKDAFPVLLNLLKKAYNQYGDPEKPGTANWWYWDLSDRALVERIQTSHQERVDELYNTPGFRSEFMSLARLWHDNHVRSQAEFHEPDSQKKIQTHFDFITYDDVMDRSIATSVDKISYGISMLLNSLSKAIAKRYTLDSEKPVQLVLDVMGKYYQESYHSRYDD